MLTSGSGQDARVRRRLQRDDNQLPQERIGRLVQPAGAFPERDEQGQRDDDVDKRGATQP